MCEDSPPTCRVAIGLSLPTPLRLGLSDPLSPFVSQDATNGGQQQRHDTITIFKIDDMRLTMLREWSLVDALQVRGKKAEGVPANAGEEESG